MGTSNQIAITWRLLNVWKSKKSAQHARRPPQRVGDRSLVAETTGRH
jgi:hypothetical protein